jgi:O-antigen/teichoic acid export membrane protein
MSEKRRIVVNTLANGVAQFAALLSALVFMPFLIRGFGANDYGLYLLASSVVGYAGLLDFGVGTSLVKLTAEAAAQGDRERLGRLTSSTLAFYTTVGVFIALIMLGLALNTDALFRVSADGARLLRNLFFVAAGASLLAWPANTGSAVLAGFQRYTLTARVSLATTIGTICATAGAVLLHEGPVVLMLSVAIVNLAGGLVNAVLAGKALKGVRVSLLRADAASLRSIFSFSWAVFVVQVCTIIVYQQTDRLVLGVFVGAAAIALYEAAGKFQGLMSQMTTFAVSAVMPMTSQLDAEGRQEALRTLFLRGTKYTLMLLSPVVVVLMVVARPLLLAWLGPEFAVVALSAQILISHQMLTSGTAVGDTMIIGLGKLPRRLPYVIGLALLNLALSLILVQTYGIMGVVLGTAIPYFIDYPLHMRLILKTIDVTPSRWLRDTVLPTYPLLLLPLVSSLVLSATPLADSLLGIAALGAVSVGLYWAGVYFWGVNAQERVELRSGAKAILARLRPGRSGDVGA